MQWNVWAALKKRNESQQKILLAVINAIICEQYSEKKERLVIVS